MKILCKVGIHLATNKSPISVELKEYYKTERAFYSCSCLKYKTVEKYGYKERRNLFLENQWLEIRKAEQAKVQEKPAVEKRVVPRKKKKTILKKEK